MEDTEMKLRKISRSRVTRYRWKKETKLNERPGPRAHYAQSLDPGSGSSFEKEKLRLNVCAPKTVQTS